MENKKKSGLGKILKSVGLGVLDSLPVVSNIKSNVESELGGKGKLDVLRVISGLSAVVVVWAVATGRITLDFAHQLLELVG